MSGKNSLEDNYKLTEYYVESVLDYTSRYNSPSSIGYAPENLVGKALRYPSYGDFPDTYTLVSAVAIVLCAMLHVVIVVSGDRNRMGNGTATVLPPKSTIDRKIATPAAQKITLLLGK